VPLGGPQFARARGGVSEDRSVRSPRIVITAPKSAIAGAWGRAIRGSRAVLRGIALRVGRIARALRASGGAHDLQQDPHALNALGPSLLLAGSRRGHDVDSITDFAVMRSC
jgi:hypothetical protein